MLANKSISNNEHQHVINIIIWDIFQMKTMKADHDFYLKCDVLLLADVFENFRNNGLQKLWIMSESLFESRIRDACLI